MGDDKTTGLEGGGGQLEQPSDGSRAKIIRLPGTQDDLSRQLKMQAAYIKQQIDEADIASDVQRDMFFHIGFFATNGTQEQVQQLLDFVKEGDQQGYLDYSQREMKQLLVQIKEKTSHEMGSSQNPGYDDIQKLIERVDEIYRFTSTHLEGKQPFSFGVSLLHSDGLSLVDSAFYKFKSE